MVDLHKVVHPVARCAQRDTIRSSAQWPDLGDDDPGTRSPTVTKVNDEEPDHGNGGPTGSLVVWPVVGVLGKENGNDDVACSHADGTGNQHGLASDSVDPQNSWDSGNEHDDANHAGGKEGNGVGGLSEILEDGRGVVKHGVDSCPLPRELVFIKKAGIGRFVDLPAGKTW